MSDISIVNEFLSIVNEFLSIQSHICHSQILRYTSFQFHAQKFYILEVNDFQLTPEDKLRIPPHLKLKFVSSRIKPENLMFRMMYTLLVCMMVNGYWDPQSKHLQEMVACWSHLCTPMVLQDHSAGHEARILAGHHCGKSSESQIVKLPEMTGNNTVPVGKE